MGDADCMLIRGNYWRARDECVLAVHDADWFAAVLDMVAVRQLSIVDAAADSLRPAQPPLPPARAPAPAAGVGAPVVSV